MPLPQEGLSALLDEGVADWDDLRAIWAELAPGSDVGPPKFRSRDLTPQQAGSVFEWWILEGFRLSGASVHGTYRVPAESSPILEQVDGLVVDGWAAFLVESKFHAEPIDINPIYRLHFLVERRPIGTLGLFFSASGYTNPAFEISRLITPIRVLLFDKIDLDWAMDIPGGMMGMVRRKWALAVKNGRSYTALTDSMDLVQGMVPDE